MKKAEKQEIKKMDEKAIAAKARELKEKISDARMDLRMGKLKDLKMVRKLRDELAVYLTVASQKRIIRQLEEKMMKGGSNAAI